MLIIYDLNAVFLKNLSESVVFFLCDLQERNVVTQKSFEIVRCEIFQFSARSEKKN